MKGTHFISSSTVNEFLTVICIHLFPAAVSLMKESGL